MQTFAAVPTNSAGQRNFVFVDEHNRHKRLKVMRACEGCRRRKIKCDAATTNTWPCSACTRLKLHCNPPVGGTDQDYEDSDLQDQPKVSLSTDPSHSGLAQFGHYPTSQQQPVPTYQHALKLEPAGNPSQQYGVYQDDAVAYNAGHFGPNYQQMTPTSLPSAVSAGSDSQPYYPSQTLVKVRSEGSDASVSGSTYTTAENLSDTLGQLKIGETGVAPYTRREKQNGVEPEGPLHEAEVKLPPLSITAGSQIRIPPALMPSDDDALHYFQTFFKDLHPYVPVIVRQHFYQQWQSSRNTMSPLLLEAVFACAGRMSDDPAQGAQWLALANKHEECFLDTPRLSTVQALLLLLKAREAAPKRGYYYRSWMTCKTIVSMAKDLELHEHYATHQTGEVCGSDPVECLTKTRLWQTILMCEMMVGAPQGRSDFGVDPDTVDVSLDPPYSNMDSWESGVSRRFAYFIRNVRNIRLITDAANKVKKEENWGLHPKLVAYNTAFNTWPTELPSDLQVSLPADGSPPWLETHFIGNMHIHYNLGIVMLHRAQLAASKSFVNDEAWKHHMRVCYSSARVLCRLQEAVLEGFGQQGLLCMQRGINFTIYSILTCTMVHLIAITSPDPEFNTDAREYFTRHMRVLEQCVSAWPMPEMEAQINALRVAFSANIEKPFELKPSFPYGSPSDQFEPSPPLETRYQHLQIPSALPQNSQREFSHGVQTITPPISAGAIDSRTDSPLFQQNTVSPAHSQPGASLLPQYHSVMPEQSQWNPTPIIEQWNTAFSIPQAALAPPVSHGHSQSSNIPEYAHSYQPTSLPQTTQAPPHQYQQASIGHTYPQHHQQAYPQYNYQSQPQQAMPQQTMPQQTMPQQTMPQQTMPQQPQQQQSYAPPAQTFVTPKDWQQSVASVFDPNGIKRRWDPNTFEGHDQSFKRMR